MTTIIKFANKIEDRTTRHKFLMKVAEMNRFSKINDLVTTAQLNQILQTIN